MVAKPIDVLIVESALRKPIISADMMAREWGEDKERVGNWLAKLRRIGVLGTAAGAYFAYPDQANDYLLKRAQPIP